MIDRLLSRPEVEAVCSLSRSTLYQMMSEGRFPRPYRLGGRRVGWKSSEIATWIDSRQPTDKPSAD